jgi:hypothetical protein
MKVKVFSWDREINPEVTEVDLPVGLHGKDLTDLAQLRVCDAWKRACTLPFEREVLETDGVCVMNWISGDKCCGPTYKVTIALCLDNDAAAEKFITELSNASTLDVN